MSEAITPKQFLDSDGVADWRLISDGACAFFALPSLSDAARFVTAIGELDGIEEHRPNIDIRFDGVTVCLLTKTAEHWGMSTRDLDLAREISAVARDQGLSADPDAIQSLLIIPGALNIKAVMPFWRAVLGYEPRIDSPDEDLVDPHDRGAGFWFEQMEEPRPGGDGAIHLAVWVPYEKAQARIDAALAAGGRLVRDESAPSWWTLADPAGNELDVATVGGRR